MIIAIDGPAGAGKSTVATGVAMALGFSLIDTGAMYRTTAYYALERGVSLEDELACKNIAESLTFSFSFEGERNITVCNGEAIGDEIRSPRVSEAASLVSAHFSVREALVAQQREIGSRQSCVLEGRDIGTVVFPDAEVKVFLTASADERARRRVAQLQERGEEADYASILADIEQRDARDSNREHSPLKKAQDAHEVDTDALGVDEVIESIVILAREKGA